MSVSYYINKVIGKGGFGQVNEVQDEKGNVLAMKKIKNKELKLPNVFEPFIMTAINHPNLCHAVNCHATSKNLYIVMPLASTDLGKVNVSSSVMKSVFFQLACGVACLHSLNIVHGDIKPDNFLLFNTLPVLSKSSSIPVSSADTVVKISDFSFSQPVFSAKYHMICTSGYRAPEVVTGEGWDLAVDVWSLACSFYEISQGIKLIPPAKSKGESKDSYIERLKNILSSEKKINAIKDEKLRHLISHMLIWNKEKRYTITDVLNHEYFSNMIRVAGNITQLQSVRKLSSKEESHINSLVNDEGARKICTNILSSLESVTYFQLTACIFMVCNILRVTNDKIVGSSSLIKEALNICNQLSFSNLLPTE